MEHQGSDLEWRMRALWLATAVLAAAAWLTACTAAKGGEPVRRVADASPDSGKKLISYYGCGSCHMIPGIDDAQGTVGPPLNAFGRRVYIAGEAPNTQENLIRWIMVPQSIEPNTAMPTLGITEGQARNIAAYLYTLR
jgi:cytochrome c1